MISDMQACKVVVFLWLFCCIKAADNDLRITLNSTSSTDGRIEIFHDGEWGAVCDDNFGLSEATTACKQLGYASAVGHIAGMSGGVSTYLLDEVKCKYYHIRLHDCGHEVWKTHDCDQYKKVGVRCEEGSRADFSSIISRAEYYWNCDYFNGTSYHIGKSLYASVHGTASFARSPMDNGFTIMGQSSWVSLGDFSSETCLLDPSTCSLYVSAWLKFGSVPRHRQFVLGNKYNGTNYIGFSVETNGHRVTGSIISSTTMCRLWDYYMTNRIWAHFSMGWSVGGHNYFTTRNGHSHGRRRCNLVTDPDLRKNHLYTVGADESLAGNANRNLDVAIDDLVIMFSQISSEERVAAINVAKDFDGFATPKLTLKLPSIPWDTTYSQPTSPAYTSLVKHVDDLTQDLYVESNIEFNSFHLENLQENDGSLQMTLALNFSKPSSTGGFRLFRSFDEEKFLNSTAEVLNCESSHRFVSCSNINLTMAWPNNNPYYASISFYPLLEHITDAFYTGYNIIAYKVNGTKNQVWYGFTTPTSTNIAHANVKCTPYTVVAVTVQPATFKGSGFRCSNFKTTKTLQAAPSSGPRLEIELLGAFNVTVKWDEITSGQNGIIRQYRITLHNTRKHYLDHVTLLVNQTRRTSFTILQPSKRYIIYACGYTAHHNCGRQSNTGWFHAIALLPAKAPRSVQVTPWVHSAQLSFKVVDPYFQYGQMKSHPVVAKNMRNGDIDYNYNIPVTNTAKVDYSLTLLGLKGLTDYQLNVSLVNIVGEGPRTTVMFTTQEGVPTAFPEHFTIVNVTSYVVVMNWTALDIEDTHGILLGYHLYYRLADINGTWHNVSTSNLSLELPVLSLRTYEMYLCGYTAVGNGECSPPVLVYTTGLRPTNVPTEIKVTNATNDTLLLEWRFVTTHNKPAQYFTITAIRNDTNITEAKEVLNVLTWTEDVYWITLEGLKEFKWYNIHISAGNLMGMGPLNDERVLNVTLEGVPSASPRNLTARNSSSQSMLLQWKPVLYEYADGIIRGHKVFWRLAHTHLPWQLLYVNGTHNTSIVVRDLEKFKDYEFKISAFTSLGEGVTTDTVIARTDEDIPLHPPVNVLSSNTSSRSLRVTWEPVPSQWQFGIIRGYKVIITDTRDGHEYTDNVPESENRSLERAGFERYTNYTVKVAAYTIKGLGNFSDPFLVITDEDIPSEAPGNLGCVHISSTSLHINWSSLPVVKAHGILRTYRIIVERNDSRHIELYRDTQPAGSLTTTFHGLDEYVRYSVRVLATTIKGEGVKSEPVTCMTDEDVPHAGPPGLHGFNTSDTSIKIFWQEVPLDDQNGNITGYTVFYNTTLRSGLIQQHEKRVGTILRTDLNSLLPFKYYDIQVAAWTSKGMGRKCGVTTILTEEESPKLAPSNVTAFNTSSTSIRLMWRQIPPEKVGGILRGYKIFWQEFNYLGSAILQNETRLDTVSHEFLDFHSLTKFQEYRFSILAFTKLDGVVSPVVSTMTDQDIPTLPPVNCSGFNISKSEINITWDLVPRADRNGIILGYNIYTVEVFNYFATMPVDYVAPSKTTVVNTTEALHFIQRNLVPYTDYSFKVDAFTSKGKGPNCIAFVVRTEQEAPLVSPGNISLHNTSSTSIKVAWQGLDLLVIRGIFLGYEIWFTAHPQFPQAYLTYGHQESSRKRRAVFTLDRQSAKAGVGDDTIAVNSLAKYTNYTVQVVGFTKFLGAQSAVFRVLTDEDVPGKPPQDFKGQNRSSTTIYIEWKPVENGFVHGILLGYRVYYRLTTMPSMPPFNMTLAPTELGTLVDGLFMFTEYTFQITAFTSKGEGKLSQEVIICTDEDVASKSPFGFKIVSLHHMHEVPLAWQPVPEGFLNGILTGYRIKIRIISDAMVDVYGQQTYIDVGPGTLRYTVRNLLNFATYTFQVVALTRYGEGVHSPIRTAKTCPCEKQLTTNWYMLPPYTNRTGEQETGIFPWLLNHLVTECCGNCKNGHGWSEILYKTDGNGMDGFKSAIPEFTATINEDTDFSFPVQGHGLQETFATFYAYVYAVASPGVAFFIVDDPPDKMPNAVLDTVNNSWGLLMFAVIFSFIAGVIMWALDTGRNELEFPNRFCTGSGEGFWWAFISMTTVGYGDRSPRSLCARLFAVFWILAGLVLTSILMGTITNALTTVTFDVSSIKLYGTKVAAIDGSPSFRIGIRRNAKVNEENKYKDAYEIQHDLRARKVKGALMDGYMAGSYNELFEDEHIRVREIIDYNNGYGIVLGGIHHRLQRCFKKFVKRKRTFIVDYVASQIKTVKKNPKSPAEEQSTNLFNPKATVFVLSMTSVMCMFGAAIVTGFCLQFYFKRRFHQKVRDSTEATYKNVPKHTRDIIETFSERISSLKKELYYKHTNELRAMSGLKRRPVDYDILAELNEEQENDVKNTDSSCSDIHDNKFTSKTLLITSPSNTSVHNDVGLNDPATGRSPHFTGLFHRGSVDDSLDFSRRTESLAMQSHIALELRSAGERPQVDTRPNIQDLQREAYLAGLKAEGKDESGHPFAKMYRYLWVEHGT